MVEKALSDVKIIFNFMHYLSIDVAMIKIIIWIITEDTRHAFKSLFVQCISKSVLTADLADNALDEFVHSEGNVGMDRKHFSQGVFVLSRLHVAIQKIAHHFQKHWVIVLYINIHCKK